MASKDTPELCGLYQEALVRTRAGMNRSRTHADIGADIALVQRHNQQLRAAGYIPPSPEEIVRTIREDRNRH